MADFFAAWQERNSGAHFLWLLPAKHDRIKNLMQQRRIKSESYSVRAVAPQHVASYLSASDAGLAFIKPCPSKLASSPTKYAEYLACGLPLIINAGIGDADALVTDEKLGALITDFSVSEYDRAITTIEAFASDAENTRRHSRDVAERCFDVRAVGAERYARLYEGVLGSTT